MKNFGKDPASKKVMSRGMKFLFDKPQLYNTALKCSPLINALISTSKLTGVHLWGKGRNMPEFAKESFSQMWKKGKVQNDK